MPSSNPTSEQSQRVSGAQWKVVALAAALGIGDFVLGPQIQFGFVHVVPVLLAAWYHGAVLGLVLATGMAALRFSFHWSWDFPMEFVPTVINTLLRLAMLALVALATARLARHVRELRQRVAQLEGLLPVCVSCGVIRREDGAWVAVSELPPPAKSVLCPRCEEKRYGHSA